LILWFLLTRKNCKVPVAANSQDQLRDAIWPEIAKWHRQLPEALKARRARSRRCFRCQAHGVKGQPQRLCKASTLSICCS
jgi:hypothetical protein